MKLSRLQKYTKHGRIWKSFSFATLAIKLKLLSRSKEIKDNNNNDNCSLNRRLEVYFLFILLLCWRSNNFDVSFFKVVVFEPLRNLQSILSLFPTEIGKFRLIYTVDVLLFRWLQVTVVQPSSSTPFAY